MTKSSQPYRAEQRRHSDQLANVMRDETLPPGDRQDAAAQLVRWLKAGGYPQNIPNINPKAVRYREMARAEAATYVRLLDRVLRGNPVEELDGLVAEAVLKAADA